MFTKNLPLGAHVHVCREHSARSGGLVRGILVNAKNPNCATGPRGIEAARHLCGLLAARLGCPPEQVLPIPTGVIGAALPVDMIAGPLDPLVADCDTAGLPRFADAIRTTDTFPKWHTRGGVAGVAKGLARDIARDGEGASRLVTIEVRGAPDEAAAVQVGGTIATSPLTKTAVAGRDPNWGRTLSAAARAGVGFDPAQATVRVGRHVVFKRGHPLPEAETPASGYLREQSEVVLGIDLGQGACGVDCWTCDLTADYVRVNADYRT